jgi:hypothetical protein
MVACCFDAVTETQKLSAGELDRGARPRVLGFGANEDANLVGRWALPQ